MHASLERPCHALNMHALCHEENARSVTALHQSSTRHVTGKMVLHTIYVLAMLRLLLTMPSEDGAAEVQI